jgi:hypothetical protein
MSEADLVGDATLSLTGADINSFGIDNRQLLDDPDEVWEPMGHNLFYEQCLQDLKHGRNTQRYLGDPRLIDAHWDDSGERALSDDNEIARRAESLCIDRTIDEYVRLKQSFDRRSMSDEKDWAYWHIKHYGNHRQWVGASIGEKAGAMFERVLFEKAFGWGVLLENLLATSAAVVLFFAVATRALCGDMDVEWDGEPTQLRKLSAYALLMMSMHSFLGGFGNSEEFVVNATSTYKALFTAEVIAGIIVTTFFIGAYTSQVLG